MVLVAMRDENAPELMFVFEHIGVVGQNEVDTQLLVIGEHEPRVNEDHIVAILEGSHVLTNAIEPTQRNDPQGSLIFCHVCGKSFLDASPHVLYIL